MRCHICNTQLSPNEIQWNKDHKDWDPCTTCLEVIDAVFTDDTEQEINDQLTLELGLDDDQGLPGIPLDEEGDGEDDAEIYDESEESS